MSKIATRFLALFLTLAMLLPNLLPVSAAEMTGQSAAVQSSEEANTETPSEGTPEGTPAGKSEGSSEGTPAGSSEGSSEGTPAGSSEGSSEGTPAGSSEGSSEGTPAGSSEGSSEGTPAGSSEGSSEGTPAGSSEGSSEGTPAGSSEGSSEGTPAGSSEGSSEGTPAGGSEGNAEGTPGEDGEKDSEDDSNENPVTHSEITSLTFDAAPETEQPVGGLIAVASGTDTASTYFTVKSATAIRVGERLYATLTVDTAYTYLYFGSKSTLDALLAAGEPVSALASPFHFTTAADSSRLTVCALKADETSETGYAVLELDLIIPEIPVPAAKEPVPVPTVKTYPAAPCDEQSVSGKMYVAKQGSSDVYPMFKIENATAVKVDDIIYVTVQVNPASSGDFTYSYLYLGTRAALLEQLKIDGPFNVVGGVNGSSTQSYHFTLPASAAGTRVPISVLKSSLTAKSPYNSSELELIVPSDIPEGTKEPVPVPTVKTYPAAPCDEQSVSGKMYVAKQGSSDVYPMFKIENATAVKVDDTIYVTVQVNPAASGDFTYSYLYLGTRAALLEQLKVDGPFDVVGGVNGSSTQSYHFTLPASAAGTRVPISVLKSDLTARSPYNSSELELIVPSDIPVGTKEPVPVPTVKTYPAAPCDEQSVSGKMYVAKQGSSDVYPMFKIENATAVKVDDTIYVTVQVNPAASGDFTYSYLYLGTRAALLEQLKVDGPFDVVGGVNGSSTQSYHFTLPASAAGTRVPISVLKSDLTARSPYNSSELELIVPSDIPEGTPDPVPTAKTYPAAPSPEQDMSGKLFIAKQDETTSYSVFDADIATAVKDASNIYVTLYIKPNADGNFPYPYLYFGNLTEVKEQLAKGGSFDVVGGTIDSSVSRRVFHFTLPLSAEGTRIAVSILKDKDNNFKTNSGELELVVPTGIPEYTPAVPAPAIPALPDNLSEAGIKVIKAEDSAEFKMFAASKTVMVIAGDKLLIHFETENTSFDKLYFGSKDDAFKSPYVQGTAGTDGGWVFEFELPASYRGQSNPVCLGKTDGSWYTSKDLLISIPGDTGDQADVKDDAEIIMVPAGGWNQPSFAISSSSAMLVGDTIYCTITGKMAAPNASKVADKLYLGSRDDVNKTPYIKGTVNGDGTTTFSFTVPADKQGTSILAVVGYTDGGWHTNQDFFLSIPNFGRKFDINYYADGVYSLYGNAYAYLDKVENRGFPVDVDSTLTVSGDTITIKWVTRASDTDKIYLGLLTDDKDVREAKAIGNADYTPIGMNYKFFTFTLPKSALGSPIPFIRHSNLWYQETNGWLETQQDYLIIGDYLPKAAVEDPGTTIEDAAMKMLAGGSEVEQSFIITSSTATLKGDTITCTVTGNPSNRLKGKSSYSLYLGNRDDKDKSSSIPGTINEDGTVTFRFTVPADKQGVCIPAVLGYDSSWDTSQDYFLNIPNFDRKFSMDYYTDGEYDLFGNAYSEQQRTANRSFPVDTQSTLTVSGDKIILKWVCRSKTYDKLYFGTLADGEDAWNAGAISNADYTPVGFGYKVFYITLPKSALGTRIPFLRHNSDGWVKTQDYLILTDYLPRLSSTPVDPDPGPTPGEGIADGTYNTTGETGASMFKVVKAVLTAKDGKYQVTLTLSGTGYDYLCVGSAADAPNKKDSWAPAKIVNCTINGETRDFYTYTFDVDDPTKPIAIASHSQKNDKWYDRTVTLNTTDLKRTAPDGSYTVTAECSASMFKIVSAKLVSVNGEMKAVLTLSGTGYDYLYPGTGEQAAKDKDNWVPFQTDADGKYTYTIPVSELDKPLTISSHSKKNDIWYDRVVTFLSSSLTKTGEVVTPDPGEDPTKPTDPETPTDPEKPDDESQHESDTSGSTTKVNNGTTLKDGVYTPDKFSFSGGSGRARIVCDKVTVKNGKAFATIRFVSTSGSPTAYSYVKASGNKYYSTGVSTFTIPVALNQNNRILGMTTKMSAAHEIEYTIYIQLKEATATPNGTAAADDTDTPDPDSKLDKEAPDIMGLTYQETVKTPKSRYLRMFRYDQGVTLVEIDLTRDTVLDTDEARAAIEKADKEAQTDSTADTAVSDEPADTAQIASDYTAALYRADVLKYLLVPEKADLPAGLEKEYLIIRLPVSNIYLTGGEAVGTLYDLGGMELVKLIGSEEPEYDLLEEALLEKQAAYGGDWDDPDYRAMVKAGIDFCLNDAGVLPLNEETRKERKLDAPGGETLTAVEYRDRLANVTDRFAVLGIPMLFDRSADEPEKEGQAAWIKLYGILLGQETKADKLYTSAVED